MRSYLIAASICFVLLGPLVAHAQVPSQIVTCTGADCTVQSIFCLGDTIIRFLVGVASFIALIALVISGLLMVTSAANPGMLTQSRRVFKTVLIGYLLILASWLIVDTIMKTLTDQQNFGVWNKMQCK